MAKLNKNYVATGLGILLIVGAGYADPYQVGVTVVGGVLTAFGVKELLKLQKEK